MKDEFENEHDQSHDNHSIDEQSEKELNDSEASIEDTPDESLNETVTDKTDYLTQISPILATTDFEDDYHSTESDNEHEETDEEERQYNYRSRSEKNNPNNRKKASLIERYPYLRYVGYAVLVLALMFTAYGGYTIRHASELMNNSYKARVSENGEAIDYKKITKPISVLIMGIDNNKERHLDSTRTDSMIVCTYNPKTGYVAMVSIPRDTYVKMSGNGYDTTGKINSAYSIDKEEGTIKAVEKLLNIPIDYYVTVDFDAVQDVVNAFGGIYVDVPFNLTEQDANGKMKVQFTKGDHQLLNGEEALAFARTRHIDNDIKRGERQQEVIEALVDRAMSAGSITKYASVLKTLNGNVQTDMTQSVIMGIAKQAMSTGVKIKHYTFRWDSFTYNGESFVALKENSVKFISHRLRVQLGLDKKTEQDKKGYKLPKNHKMDPDTYPSYGVEWDYANE